MANHVYALLIAIDKYQHPVPPLGGCVRDSQDLKAYLEATVPPDQLKLMTLWDAAATKDRIVDAFLSHLNQAGPDDTVLLHYAGHGSQEKAPEVFWEMEPDHKNETLVCYDSRRTIQGEYHRDLADKELRALIHQVAQKNPHIVTIFDCCHAGSNTRTTAKVTSRQAPDDKTAARSLDQYVFMQRDEFADTYRKEFEAGRLRRKTLPQGNHIALQGSRSVQTAKELAIDGKTGGIFTYSLLKALKESQGDITYAQLIGRAAAFVQSKVADQDPMLDVVFSETLSSQTSQEANRIFLRGSLKKDDKSFPLSWDRKQGAWTVEAGELNGLPRQGQVQFAVYAENHDITADPDGTINTAVSKKVHGTFSTVNFTGSETIVDKNARFKATVLQLPLARTRVSFEAEDQGQKAGRDLLIQAFEQSGQGSEAKKYLEKVAPGEESDYRIVAFSHQGEQKYGIFRPADTQPLTGFVMGHQPESARSVLARMASIARWDRTKELENPSTQIPADSLKLQIEAIHMDPQTETETRTETLQPDPSGEVQVAYEIYGDVTESSWGRTPVYKISVTNSHPSKTFHCALLYMGSDFSVRNLFTGEMTIGPGQTKFADGGNTLAPHVPEELVQLGLTQDSSYLKLVASTEPFKPDLLEQNGLDYPTTFRDVIEDSLSALLNENRTRSLLLRKPKKVTDWTTRILRLTNVWSGTSAEESAVAQSNIKVDLPADSQATVKISNLGNASRSLSAQLPGAEALRFSPLARTLEVAPGQGFAPGKEVVEIEGLKGVSEATPLVFRFKEKLGADESLITVQEEDGILLPVLAEEDENGLPVIRLTHIPESEVQERGIGRSIKLLFHKMLSGKFGIKEFPYPRLGIVTQAEQETSLNFETDELKAAVAGAQRILLTIHGYTSECVGCFFSATEKYPEHSLYKIMRDDAGYDLVLGYEYETLDTPIQSIAASLRRKLAEVGLGPNHSKELHILAHSLGGLVSRYFIEMLEGHKVVSQLIMAGTPNGGSPWASIKEWALLGSTLLLNNIPGVGWGLSAVGFLLNLAKSFDDSLESTSDAMKPSSDFLSTLTQAPDPGIPYFILAGSIDKRPDDPRLRESVEATKSKLEKVLSKLSLSNSLKKIFKDQNDIAVGVGSILNVPENRSPEKLSEVVACNHFGYFSKDGALEQLKSLLMEINGVALPVAQPLAVQPDTTRELLASEPKSKIKKLVAVLDTIDLEKTVAFYSSYLGFQLKGDWGLTEEKPMWARMERDGVEIQFFQANRPHQLQAVKDWGFYDAVFYLEVESVEQFRAELLRKGLNVGEIEEQPYGMREFYLKDPDGHQLTIGEAVKKS
jgi:uncharacterized glyoxalase superfamily protein PhnB/pimeloyl-ACP methyl ester carboxylesterase